MAEQLLGEWWTYTISDFLLFSPRTYYRMLALYNRAVWPAHFLGFVAGISCLLLLRRGSAPRTSRWILLIMALAWAWVAWKFHFERYATINWAALYAAMAFLMEAVLLGSLALSGRLVFLWQRTPVHWLGLALYVFALLLYPLLAVLFGRGWSQSELFGLAPDPTALATVGLLLMSSRIGLVLLPIPLLWCVTAALTLFALSAPEVWIMAAGAILALFGAVIRVVSKSP
jgi:hypothetical protein